MSLRGDIDRSKTGLSYRGPKFGGGGGACVINTYPLPYSLPSGYSASVTKTSAKSEFYISLGFMYKNA